MNRILGFLSCCREIDHPRFCPLQWQTAFQPNQLCIQELTFKPQQAIIMTTISNGFSMVFFSILFSTPLQKPFFTQSYLKFWLVGKRPSILKVSKSRLKVVVVLQMIYCHRHKILISFKTSFLCPALNQSKVVIY